MCIDENEKKEGGIRMLDSVETISERWLLVEEINLISGNARVADCDKIPTIIESIEAETNRRQDRSLAFSSFFLLLWLLASPSMLERACCANHREKTTIPSNRFPFSF